MGRRAAGRFDFKAYVASLMSLAQPELPRISVVVPSYNYARYMKQRMASILAQTQPVLEVIVLDDASTDDSVEVARGCRRRVEPRRAGGGIAAQLRIGVQAMAPARRPRRRATGSGLRKPTTPPSR